MKTWKLIGLLLAMSFLGACTAEEIVNNPYSDKTENETGTLIAISMDNLIPVNMNSRATCIDGLLAHVEDLNIRLTNEDGTNVFIYCSEKNPDPMTGGGKVNYVENQKMDNLNTGKNAYIHYNSKNTKRFKKVEVLANCGKQITTLDIWNQTMKDVAVPAAVGSGLEKCYLYGMDNVPELVEHSGGGSTRCDKYEIAMRRSRAMLTVKIDGTTLREGVTIVPTKFSLHNLPASCQMDAEKNKIAVGGAARAEIVSYAPASLGWDNAITSGNSVGVHADKSASSLPDNFHPIYIYENMQGQTSNTNKVTKWPEGCTSIAEAAANKTHSYIEIEADYKYEEGGSLKNSGTIIYRFFLGKNDFDDFNVERNTYYKLTLQLKNFGGAKEDGRIDENGNLMMQGTDASWRVDMNIRDWGFEKSEYDFDAHAVIGEIAVMGSGWILKSMEGADKYSSWLRFKSDDYGTAGWAEPADKNIQGKNGKIIFYIQPMQSWEFTNYSNEKRTITLIIEKGSQTQTITISQWTPIKINNEIWMERFEEDDCLQSWGFPNIDVTNKSIDLNGNKNRKYIVGENVPKEKELGNTYYGYQQVKDAAHAYCYRKGGGGIEGSPAGSAAEPYALPDQNTFQLLLDYSRSHPNGNFDPIKEYEDYWTSSVFEGEGAETNYWNGENQSYATTAERTMKKRTRAVFIGQTYN